MSEIIVRNVMESDISRIAEIEAESFSNPWTENTLRSEFFFRSGIFLTAEKDGKILGCIIGSQDLETAFIDNIAAAVSARRQGVGTALMKAFFEELYESVTMVSLEVRESNIAAQKLYSKFGFENAGIRKNLYSAPRENGIVMTLDLKKD